MAVIPPFFFDCVIAIGSRDKAGAVSFSATGFLYGHPQPSTSPTMYRVYLVTNRHVLTARNDVVLRFNAMGGTPAQTFDLSLTDSSGRPLFLCHSDAEIDIGVMFINAPVLQQQGIQFAFFKGDAHASTLSRAASDGVSEGSAIFLLGFPMGDAGKDRNFVVARQGCIARMRDTVAGVSKHFLADVVVLPGNSGGPVVTRPEVVAIQGTKTPERADLLGIVAGYIPYSDVAVSLQTNRPRVVFEENSGLAVAFPVEHIQAVITQAEAHFFPPDQPQPSNPADPATV